MKLINRTLLLILSASLFITSCQKEVDFQGDLPPGNNNGNGNGNGGTTNKSLIGDYNFVGMEAHTNVTVTVSETGMQLKTVSVSDYESKNNVGTIKLTAKEMISSNLAYSIDDVMYAEMFMNGVSLGVTESPFAVSIPPSSQTTTYKLIGTDSIVIDNGPAPSNPMGITTGGSIGYKLKWSGDTLIMKMGISATQPIIDQGLSGTMVSIISSTMKLKKK